MDREDSVTIHEAEVYGFASHQLQVAQGAGRHSAGVVTKQVGPFWSKLGVLTWLYATHLSAQLTTTQSWLGSDSVCRLRLSARTRMWSFHRTFLVSRPFLGVEQNFEDKKPVNV